MAEKIKKLVVDTGALINGLQCQSIADAWYTVPEVIVELRDKHTRTTSMYQTDQMIVRNPSPAAMSFGILAYNYLIKFIVISMCKKTGDFPALSMPDIRVMALTLDLEREHNQGDISHLRTDPLPIVTYVGAPKSNLVKDDSLNHRQPLDGWYTPTKLHTPADSDITIKIENMDISDTKEQLSDNEVDIKSESEESEEEQPSESDDDEESWITPTSLANAKSGTNLKSNDLPVEMPAVACVTTDFAMQNVLLHIGLKLYSVQGYRIKTVKTFVLRCHACYNITHDMDRVFCPRCGNDALIRTSTSLSPDDGALQVHLKKNFSYRKRGTVYSMPTPQTGRNAKNIVLCEDQKECLTAVRKKMWETKKRNKEANEMGFGDGNSKDHDGAGFGGQGDRKSLMTAKVVVGYGRKNPNEGKHRVGKKKRSAL